jgi:hypothetical protein
MLSGERIDGCSIVCAGAPAFRRTLNVVSNAQREPGG